LYSARRSLLAALLTTLAASPARAEIAPEAPSLSPHGDVERATGLVIAKVTLAGNRRVPSEDLAGYLEHLRPNQVFSPEGLTADVRALWASDLLDDVSVDLRVEDAGVVLRITVRERPSIDTITFAGNHAIDGDDLEEALGNELRAGDLLGHAAIGRAVQKLRDKYAEEGFYLAEVKSEIVPAKNGKASVRFTITERDKLSVRAINFVGNSGITRDELLEVMLTGKGGILGSLGIGMGGPLRQDMLERDVLMLSALYYDKGYLMVQIGTPRIAVRPDHEGIEITLPVTEGPRFRIRNLRVSERDTDGREIEPLGGRRHLREMIHAGAGDFFSRAELVKDLAGIQTLYRDAGYAFAEVSPSTDLDPDRAEVDVTIGIRRGKVVRFGRIEIKGNTKTRDKVIRREMEIVEGGLFNETALERSKRRVNALGFFERVDVSTAQGASPDTLDVTVEIAEKPTGTFQVGAGFSSMESFIFTSQIQQNNLFGRGQALSLNAQISGTRKQLDFRFVEPRLFDTKISASIALFDQLRTYDSFGQETRGGTLTLGRYLVEPHLTGSLTYNLQQDKVATSGSSASLGTANASSVFQRLPLRNLFADGTTSSIRPTITYDTRDNALFPTSGMFLQGSVEVASKVLGSENQFVRWRGTGRFYWPLTDDHSVVLRLNTEAGLVTSPSPSGVPVFARFFLGGIYDVRGFPLRSLGPRLPLAASLDPSAAPIPLGANIGGNLMFYQNLEIEFPILSAIGVRGVVFTDLGNAWNTERQYCRAAPAARYAEIDPCFSLSHLLAARASWGFGIRWSSPMGPLRFEWGFPFKPLPYEKPSLFELTIGGAF
jgi:outer membrane protein insertion porin family